MRYPPHISRAARSRRRRRRRRRRCAATTRSEELPSIVWMLPSAPTDSTMPMCSSQTIRSPGCGRGRCRRGSPCQRAGPRPTRRRRGRSPGPRRRSARRPGGRPRRRSRRTTGRRPEPAVAWRYCAMRGESLEPGGCSATPTSARASVDHRLAGGRAAGAGRGPAGGAWPWRPGGRRRRPWRSSRAPRWPTGCGGASMDCSCAMRLSVASRLMARQAATAGAATSRSTSAHCSAATCALRCSVTYALAAAPTRRAQRLVGDQLAQDLAHLGRRRGVEAGDAVLDVGVHGGVGDRAAGRGARLEPAQVALAAVEAAVAGRGERDVVQRHRGRVGVERGERDAQRALRRRTRPRAQRRSLADADEAHVGALAHDLARPAASHGCMASRWPVAPDQPMPTWSRSGSVSA